MDRSKVIYLIIEKPYQDEEGVWRSRETKRKVYANISSVSQTEWFEGGRNGLNPSLRATLFFYDYHDEEIVEVDNKRYTVYRNYFKDNDKIELYLEYKKGNADGEEQTC